MSIFFWNAHAENTHIEATLNHPFPAQVNPETWLADSLRRGGAAFGEPGDGLAAKVCLARSTPDETPACAASRRNATRCGG